MISPNSFDAIEARAAGMRAGWVNRHGDTLDKVGGQPDIVAQSLIALVQKLIEHANA